MKNFIEKGKAVIKSVLPKWNSKDSNSIDFSGKLEKFGETLFMKSYDQETKVEQKGENLFVIGDIEGNEKEIMEVADFINKAKNIALRGIFQDNELYVDKVIFDYTKGYSDNEPYVNFVIEYKEEVIEEMDGEYEAGFGKGESIIEPRIWKKLKDNNMLKKNIVKIINHLNQRGKENKLDDLGNPYREKDILSDFA